jgi:hypothetical protein
MVVDADLKSAHALNGFHMLFSRVEGQLKRWSVENGPLTRIVMRYAEQLAI